MIPILLTIAHTSYLFERLTFASDRRAKQSCSNLEHICRQRRYSIIVVTIKWLQLIESLRWVDECGAIRNAPLRRISAIMNGILLMTAKQDQIKDQINSIWTKQFAFEFRTGRPQYHMALYNYSATADFVRSSQPVAQFNTIQSTELNTGGGH